MPIPCPYASVDAPVTAGNWHYAIKVESLHDHTPRRRDYRSGDGVALKALLLLINSFPIIRTPIKTGGAKLNIWLALSFVRIKF